jgi:diguanylate cyclase (GGDEF)-like protein
MQGSELTLREKRANVWKSVSFHGLVGSLAGYLLLHPASVLIHQSFEDSIVSVEALLEKSFSTLHLPMALYFTLIGTVVGVAYGFHHIRISRLYEKVKKLSITDPLTSLYNRRYLMERLENEVDRCGRYGRSLSLIMADIDHFKNYNDTQGHQRGDELLRAVADRFRSLVRKPDFVARYGGEEFIVVMPETECREAFHLAERMREAVNSLEDAGSGSQREGKITVSLGIAEMPIHAKDAATLVREADRALYRAKEEGRNRVVMCAKDEP